MVVICPPAWTKDRWTGKKVAEYVTENVEVEQWSSILFSAW